ncbi:Rad60-SLD domain protein [Rhizoctonia solani AG-3 Rhs1AP]|uniref:Rad60-SLD domain protein n=2 Tax=Rhizoctonia solani AG-3 TaxID=1086053 RepID=A0A074SK32_9AGAM|nr:Rad60-SLD domain protein [Rhizoctonia solani AG-3 Rhs1AP]KEP50382.1 Rad60-SLD domain protein [Rhizoctonia solani 123E]
MSARPRPKPRPKPKVTSEPSTSATSLESSRAKSPASVNDDDLFIRHDPNRLLYNQKKPREKSPLRDVKYFDNGDSDESPDSKRRKKDLAPKRAKPLPSWTFQTRDPTLANVDSDDDSSELEILEDDAFKDVPSAPLPKPKLRERSITPPPQDLRYQIGNQVHELLHNLYDVDDDRELSPEMESQDCIQLLPELAAIQKHARASSAAPELEDARSVDLHIKWIPHPTHPEPWESTLKSWDFNVPLSKPFGEIRRMLTGLPMTTQPILRWQSRRLFDGGTPASLLAGSKLDIKAMTKPTNEYFEERHQIPLSAPGSDAADDLDGASGSRDGSPAVAEKITLRLRTGPKDARPTAVKVFPDATIQTVIEAFLAKTGRAGTQGVSLQIDGDDLEMDSTVADADLEDGDLVEVAGIE